MVKQNKEIYPVAFVDPGYCEILKFLPCVLCFFLTEALSSFMSSLRMCFIFNMQWNQILSKCYKQETSFPFKSNWKNLQILYA